MQKGESQNDINKKTKQAKFSEKQAFLTSCYRDVPLLLRGKKCSFFGKFGVLFFLLPAF